MEDQISSIEEYVARFPLNTQKQLNIIKETIKKTIPQATEVISYGMPTFKLGGNLVHFAAYKNHIGFYPGPKALVCFKQEISSYKNSKGAVQFPLNAELPLDLIEAITLFCVAERKKKIADSKPLFQVSAPARRALASKAIVSFEELSKYTEDEILALHGIGKTTIPILKQQLAERNLSFKE
ncbi:MAG TPA: DUF1801 domain-containing protein [Pelobium sp.]|nr:DUF1801 domain-containing protein [Pelobium sp.]